MRDNFHKQIRRYVRRHIANSILLFGFWIILLAVFEVFGPKIAEDHFTLYLWILRLLAVATTMLYIKHAYDRFQAGDFFED